MYLKLITSNNSFHFLKPHHHFKTYCITLFIGLTLEGHRSIWVTPCPHLLLQPLSNRDDSQCTKFAVQSYMKIWMWCGVLLDSCRMKLDWLQKIKLMWIFGLFSERASHRLLVLCSQLQACFLWLQMTVLVKQGEEQKHFLTIPKWSFILADCTSC